MVSSSSRSMQKALMLNLIIFIAGTVLHNVALGDFSYASILSDVTGGSALASIQGYFALNNSSATITGMLLVFAYAAVFSLAKFFVKRMKRVYEPLINTR